MIPIEGGNIKDWASKLEKKILTNDANVIIPDSAIHPSDKKVSYAERISSRLQAYTTEQKMHAGMNFLVAGLCAMGAFSQLSKGVAKDEVGERHIQPTQIGMGMVSALLAAGSAYLGVQALRAR